MIKRKNERSWICSCKRKNDPDETICGFCQQPKPGGPIQKSRASKAYDEEFLWPVFSLYIRLRDTDKNGFGKCFTCPRILNYKRGDSGHGVPRQYKGTKYNEQNNHLQCKPCNGFEGGAREAYKEEMDKRYGKGTWDKMKVASRQIFKLGKVECDIMIEFYKVEIRKLLKEKNFKIDGYN